MKYRSSTAIVALIVNLICVVSAIHLVKNYHDLFAMKLSPEIRLKADEEYLHLVCYGALPAHIVVMSLSGLIFWRLRK